MIVGSAILVSSADDDQSKQIQVNCDGLNPRFFYQSIHRHWQAKANLHDEANK